jgi:predicted CXXCH cytochrome family protein
LSKSKFLPEDLPSSYTNSNYNNFCLSCHNTSGEAHDKSPGSASTNRYDNMTGSFVPGSYTGDSHSWNGAAKGAGTRIPTDAQLAGHMPNSRVLCQTCHGAMDKSREENIASDSSSAQVVFTTNDNGDLRTYRFLNGADTFTKPYLTTQILVYRNSAWGTSPPANRRTRKQSLANPSEYTYYPATATVVFKTAQPVSASSPIFVEIPQPYFRASNQANAVCLDCHQNRRDTAVTHPAGAQAVDNHPVQVSFGHTNGMHDTLLPAPESNIYIEGGQVLCTSCHKPHNSPSKDGGLVREAKASELCGDCHKINGFRGHTTGLLSNHSGAKHTGGAVVCLNCHTTHATTNVMLIRNDLRGTQVNFRNLSGANSLGSDGGVAVCQACHTKTKFQTKSGGAGGHNTGKNCLKCHPHNKGFQASGGGGAPCYPCHDGSLAQNIKSLMGLDGVGGKPSRHNIAFDNASTSSCLTMCHTSNHESGGFNLHTTVELAVCLKCHSGAPGTTSRGKSISVGGNFVNSQHNYTETATSDITGFSYPANCTKCHFAHGADDDHYPLIRQGVNGRTTNGNTNELCFGCHSYGTKGANIERLWKANPVQNRGHYNFTSTTQDQMLCTNCHGAHGSQNSKMISDNLGGPAKGGQRLVRDKICLVCHSGSGAPGESIYNVMSNAPGSYGPNFSAASFHDFTLAVAIGGHTEDLTCVGCHDPHNTGNARLMQDTVVFTGLTGPNSYKPVSVNAVVQPRGGITKYISGWSDYCLTCHYSIGETGGQSPFRRHPVGANVTSFELYTTGLGMRKMPLEGADKGYLSCISCHYTHGSPKEKLLRFEDKDTPNNHQCLQCHRQDQYLGGGEGSHGGFIGKNGNCSDCHNMHTKATRTLLQEQDESKLCYNCHRQGGASKFNSWVDYTSLNPYMFKGTGGTFGRYSALTGGTSHSMHDINEEASPAPGGITTKHRCGTCHNPHGSKNYRVLRTTVNNYTGLYVYARTDAEGNFVNYSTGMTRFCSACHEVYKETGDGYGNWIRHPVDVSLSNYSAANAVYKLATTATYLPKIELETRENISCATCHYAHGSAADANLKYPGGNPVNACKSCHNRNTFDTGQPGSHAGFAGNNGSCSDCHSMHADGNRKLLRSDAETAICVNCHDNPGTSTSKNSSHMDVWRGNVFDTPTSWFGTAGSFGVYDPVNGGNATSMHKVNGGAQIAPGDSATMVQCGTCHDSHGGGNYRLLKKKINGKGGIFVSANIDSRGRTTSYNSGMSSFCLACHKTYGDCGTAAGYTRHPLDIPLTAQEMANYARVNGQKYLPLESGNKITCTTCHFAHGSPLPKMLRMPAIQLCQACHAKGLDTANNYADVAYTHGGFNGTHGDCTACHYTHRLVYNHRTTATLNRRMLVESDEPLLCRRCHGPGGNATQVWRGDSPATPTAWDGLAGSYGAFYNSTTGGSIQSLHMINKTNAPAPGGSTVDHRCGSCHNPHGSNNFRILRETVNNVPNIKVRVNRFGQYSTGVSDFCTACHTVYAQSGTGIDGYTRHPETKAMTAAELANLSTTPGDVMKAQIQNGKVMCLSCHFSHGSPSFAMLRLQSYTSSRSQLCQQCHKKGYNPTTGQQFRYTHGGFNGNNANCGVCHSVHAKNYKKLLVESKESKLCDNCHSGIGKFNEFRAEDSDVKIDKPSRFNVFSSIGNSFGNYSVGGGNVKSWHEVDGVHTAPGGKTMELRCGKCHNSHGGDNFTMLRESIEGTNNIKVFGHLSSTGPFNTYSSGFASFCSACHTKLTKCGTGNPWTRHPVDFKLKNVEFNNWSATPIKPRVPLEAGNQVTCITCHTSHGSGSYSLQRLDGNGACQQCHTR